jgi:phosphoribosylanthranilate isomerase
LARLFEPVTDIFLTDTLLTNGSQQNGEQPVSGFVGITGRTCDWNTATQLVQSSKIPVILAGGITPENVSNGVRHVQPAGVDSCSGTNAVDSEGRVIRFKKDIDKLKRFIQEVRKAERMIHSNNC